jgi:Predicted membrane protein (DUF2142)
MRLAVGLIVFAALLRGLVWGVLIPPWQGPDEPAHFAYIQRIATTGTIPAQDYSPPEYFSDATNVSVNATSFGPSRTRQPLRYLRRGLPGFPVERDDLSQINHGGLIVWKYPPVYYLIATPAYMLPFLHTDTERMYAVRAVSAIMGAIAVWLVLLLLLEAGVTPLIAVLATSTFALLPMVDQASAICNPDVLLGALLAGLARSLLVLCRGWTWGAALIVSVWAILAMLTKPIGGPAAAVVIVAMLGFGMGRRTLRRRAGATAALAAALVVTYAVEAVAATWSVFGTAGAGPAIRYGISYLWQFYLPPLPFMDTSHAAYHSFGPLASWHVWIQSGVGFFGWLTVAMPAWAYNLAFWSLVAATALALWAGIRRPGPGDRAVPALLAAALGYVLLLHGAEVLLLLQGSGELLLQGRYLIPIVPLFAVCLYQPFSRLGRTGVLASGALLVVAAVLSVEATTDVLVFFG